MVKTTKTKKVEPKLSNALLLNRYMLSLFGTSSLEALSEHLKDPVLEGYDENNVSLFYHEMCRRLFPNGELTAEKLLEYDQNIYRHTEQISKERDERIRWKYFQYLSLIFTEIYLLLFCSLHLLYMGFSGYAHIFDAKKTTYLS